jgi:hypothetical protein
MPHDCAGRSLLKLNFDCISAIPPTDAQLEIAQTTGAKKMGRKNESGTLYGKNHGTASDFLPREPANAIIHQ